LDRVGIDAFRQGWSVNRAHCFGKLRRNLECVSPISDHVRAVHDPDAVNQCWEAPLRCIIQVAREFRIDPDGLPINFRSSDLIA
jgi:hypothetical protein